MTLDILFPHCPINGLTVRVSDDENLLPVCKTLVLVAGQRDTRSKLETLDGGGRRIVTQDVICPYQSEDGSADEHAPCYNVISHCTEDNMANFTIHNQTALMSVTQANLVRTPPGEKNKMNLVVDAVYQIQRGDLPSTTKAWKGYIELVQQGKRMHDGADEPPEDGPTPRKCRKLTCWPSNTFWPAENIKED